MAEQNDSPHTAISTWSGYVYQGKIALFHTLKLLVADRAQTLNHKLQLESADDFAILSQSNIHLSLHQVKAYKSDMLKTN